MNIRRIPIALFILLGVCATLAYLIGSFRPFAPSAKFSNVPPPLSATKVSVNTLPTLAPTAETTRVEPTVPSTSTPTAEQVEPESPSDTPTRFVKSATPNLPTNTATRVPNTNTPLPASSTATRVPNTKTPTRIANTSTPLPTTNTVTRIVNTSTPLPPPRTSTRVLVEASLFSLLQTATPPPTNTVVVTRVAQATVAPTRSVVVTRIAQATEAATRSVVVTRIAQATEAATEPPTPDAGVPTETPSVAPVVETQNAVATQTSVLAEQTVSAIATRAFSPPTAKQSDPTRAINNSTNFLLIGTDSRTTDPTWVPNTDVMMVLFLDTNNQRAALLSLPRDLVVAIPGQQAFRINSAYHHGWATGGVEGGVNVLKEILRDDFEIRIDHWALIDFDGLSQIIDTLGGIEVNVPCALSDTIDEQPFTIPAGDVQMDYLTAKRYVQSRYTTSDTSRNHRQQRVVWAMAKKALAMNAPDRVPLLYDMLRENVATDMNLFSMIGLIPAVYQLDLQNHPERLRARVLEAPAVYPWVSTSGAWLYMPNYEIIQQQLDEIFDAPQVATNEVTRAECPTVPATPVPTDVPTVTPTAVTVTPEVEPTLTESPSVTPMVENTPTDIPTPEPTAEATPEPTETQEPETEVTPGVEETAVAFPTFTPVP